MYFEDIKSTVVLCDGLIWKKLCQRHWWEIRHPVFTFRRPLRDSSDSRYLDLQGKFRSLKTEVPRGRDLGLLWSEHLLEGGKEPWRGPALLVSALKMHLLKLLYLNLLCGPDITNPPHPPQNVRPKLQCCSHE